MTHERVDGVDRHVEHQPLARQRRAACVRHVRPFVLRVGRRKLARRAERALELARDVARRAVLAVRQLELVAEHAQHAPAGPRLADGVGHGVEALPAPFGIDESARRLDEGADRQQDVRDLEQIVGSEGREGDDGGTA
jgi:hypothetical protein